MSLNDETKDLEGAKISEEELNAVAGGAGPDANGNFICPYCREYALKPGEDVDAFPGVCRSNCPRVRRLLSKRPLGTWFSSRMSPWVRGFYPKSLHPGDIRFAPGERLFRPPDDDSPR